jgi:sigma-B regulation protein RsbQ
MANDERPDLSSELRESFCTTDPAITHHFATVAFTADHRKDLAKLNVPSLVLQCSQDILAPLEVGEYIHEQTRGSTLRILKATGHCPHVSAPDETIAVIKEYLSEA